MASPTAADQTKLQSVNLKRAWKGLAEQYPGELSYETGTKESAKLRVHRSLSWIMRAEAFDDIADADCKFILSWVALNALYARWQSDPTSRRHEYELRNEFISHFISLDAAGRIQAWVKQNRGRCDAVLSEEHLQTFYWKEPSRENAIRARGSSRKVGKSYHSQDTIHEVLDPLLERISLLRSQLVHGQSTFGSKFNRDIVELCAGLVHEFVLQLLSCVIDDDLWRVDELWQGAPFQPMEPLFRK